MSIDRYFQTSNIFAIHFTTLCLWVFAIVLLHFARPHEEPRLLIGHGIAGCIAIQAAAYDLQTLRLPHELTLSAAIVAVLTTGLWGEGWETACTSALTSFFCLKLVQWICRWKHQKECLGSGDAILMLSLGAMIGLVGLPFVIALAALFALIAVYLLKKDKLAFGPLLVGSSLLVYITL